MAQSGRLTRFTLRAMDAVASVLLRPRSAGHLATGRRGEEEAYFYLRQRGYVIVARNYRGVNSRSEIDLIGWDGEMLCFVEVKTRTAHDVKPAEAAVDQHKQRDLSIVAREFLRKTKENPPFRFDIVSVYFEPGRPPQVELFQNAFSIA